ncbi:MAG: GNAT family N-acetyltransferase [Ferruginibacter sp.]|nr:GNAT family N-acetyltransferase [Ferruginibacter sp.]
MDIIIETPRLVLRRFTEADAPLVYQLNSNPAVVKYIHEPALQNPEQAKEIIRDIILPQYRNNLGRWAIHTKENNEFIGWCGLKYLKASGETDLGYRLHQFAWGKGFATEAAKHTLDHGFIQLHLKAIMGKAHVDNTGSINVLQKIGMQFIKETVEDHCPLKVFMAANPNR